MSKKSKRSKLQVVPDTNTGVTEQATHTTVTLPAHGDGSKTSIRQLILRGLVAGEDRAAIGAKVVEAYPTSRAAALFSRHYGWYKTRMNKQGTPEFKAAQKLRAALVEQATPAVPDDTGTES